MAQEFVREHDQLRDATPHAISTGQTDDDVLPLAADEVPRTDPNTGTKVKDFTNAAKGATVDLSATNAVAVDEDTATVTSVTYKPAGSQAAPSVGNSRTWLVKQGSTTVASFTFSSVSAAFVSGTPVAFALGTVAVTEGNLTLESAHVSSGVADPGGTLEVTYTF